MNTRDRVKKEKHKYKKYKVSLSQIRANTFR